MSVHLRFILTFDDYLKAQYLHSKRSWWQRLWYYLNRTLAPALGVLFVLVGLMINGPGVPRTAVLIAIVCGLFLASYPLYLRFRYMRCYRRTRTGDGANSVELDEERIRISADNTKSELNWKAVKSYLENNNLFMLYLAPAKFIALPTRAMTPNQVSEVRSLIANQLRSISKP